MQSMKADMQSVNADMQSMKADMQSVNADMQSMKADMQSMKADMQSMKADMQSMNADMQSVNADMQSMNADMQIMNKKISGIELHLENTTDNNIKLIAEGHLDLSRKLDKALEIENEKELLLIRVNYLESEVKRIKSRLAEIS